MALIILEVNCLLDDLYNAKDLFTLKTDKNINHISDNNSMEYKIKDEFKKSEMKSKIDALYAIEEIEENQGFF